MLDTWTIIRIGLFIGGIQLAIDEYADWKKTKGKYADASYDFWLAIFLLVVLAWSYFGKYFFTFTPPVRIINLIATITLLATTLALVLLLQLKRQFFWRFRKISDKELLEKYSNELVIFGKHEQLKDVDSRKIIRKTRRQLQMLYAELRRRDQDAKNLLPLLQHQDDYVRLWTANSILPKFEKEALLVLDEIGSQKGRLGAIASHRARLWREEEKDQK